MNFPEWDMLRKYLARQCEVLDDPKRVIFLKEIITSLMAFIKDHDTNNTEDDHESYKALETKIREILEEEFNSGSPEVHRTVLRDLYVLLLQLDRASRSGRTN